MKWVFNAYDEIMQTWCYAEDLESFEHVAMEASRFLVGAVRASFLSRFPSYTDFCRKDCDPDLRDDVRSRLPFILSEHDVY